MTRPRPVLDRLRDRVEIDAVSGCWNYRGVVTAAGYGLMWNENGRKESTHRISYRCHHGPIPDGLQIDHLCRNRACCNPDHLEAVTARENIRRSEPATRQLCLYGHDYSAGNAYINPATGQRECRTCRNERGAMHNAQANAERGAARAAQRAAAVCIECGGLQGHTRRRGKYCSESCRQRHRRADSPLPL